MAEIEYFYSAHSAFAYIGDRRLHEIAREAGARIVHRPFDLRRLMSATGGAANSMTPERRAYLSRREIEEYLDHRMAVAGCPRRVFSSAAVDRIYESSKGVPRVANTMAGEALLSAFVAGRNKVEAEDIDTESIPRFETAGPGGPAAAPGGPAVDAAAIEERIEEALSPQQAPPPPPPAPAPWPGVRGGRIRTGGLSPRTISRKLRLVRALGSLARRLNRESQAGVSPTGNVKWHQGVLRRPGRGHLFS